MNLLDEKQFGMEFLNSANVDLTFQCKVEPSEFNEKCYLRGDPNQLDMELYGDENDNLFIDSFFRKQGFLEEIEVIELFDFHNFKIFSSNGLDGRLRFTDHLTGMHVGTFKNKEACLKQLNEKLGVELYINGIKKAIKTYGITPSYKLVITERHGYIGDELIQKCNVDVSKLFIK